MKNTTYCLKCKTQTPDANPKYIKLTNKIRKSSTCAKCGCKKSKFNSIKKIAETVAKNVHNGTIPSQHGKGLISNLIGKPIPVLSDIPILNLLF